MKQIIIALCAGGLSFSMVSAFADEGRGLLKRLKGTYAYTFDEICAEIGVPSVNDPGFTPFPRFEEIPYPPISDGSLSVAATGAGTITFDGAGNAKSEASGGYVLPKLGPLTQGFFTQPYGTFSNACESTYSVEPDNRFSIETNCNVVLETGGAPGANDETGPIISSGYIGRGGNVLLSAGSAPIEQTIVRYFQGNVFYIKRLCVTKSTYIRAGRLHLEEEDYDGREPDEDDDLDSRRWY